MKFGRTMAITRRLRCGCAAKPTIGYEPKLPWVSLLNRKKREHQGLFAWTARCFGQSGTFGSSQCREGALIYNINDVLIGRALDKYREISRGEIIFLSQLIHPGMTVIEVGANIGVLTVPFARLV